MDIKTLLDLAKRFRNVPEIAELGVQLAHDARELTKLIATNHTRAEAVLRDGELAEIEAIHAETLAAIDAFDAELAKAAAR